MNNIITLVKKKSLLAFDNVKKIFSFRTVLDLIILWIQIAMSIFRVRIGASMYTNFKDIVLAKFDSGYFVDSVLNFDTFNYLTPYSLIKNRAYMWFLLVCHYLKLNPHIGVSILHVIAAFLIYRVSMYICKNRATSLLFFIYVLYHPIAFYFMGEINFYRNTIYVPFVYYYLALLIILANRIYLNRNNFINWIISIMLGITLIITFFMSETGITQIMIYSFFAIIFTICIMIKTEKFDISKLIKSFCLLVFPLLIFAFGFVSYKFINYRVYGVYDINMRTEGEIGKFIENLQDIESDSQNSMIWCSIDQIDKAYNVSQTFKEHKQLYSIIKAGGGASAYIQGKGYAGDFLGWGITQGLVNTGIDYGQAKKIFKSINRELETAFELGLLKRTKKIKPSKTLGRYTFDEMKEIRDLSFETAKGFINFKDFYMLVNIFGDPISLGKEFDRYFEFYNVEELYEPINYYDFVVETTNYYSFYQKILLGLLFIALTLMIVNNISNFKKKLGSIKNIIFSDCNFYTAFAAGFFVLYYLYILAISMFLIWLRKLYNSGGWNPMQLEYNYTSIAYVFLTLCFIFTIASILSALRDMFKQIKFKKIHIDTTKKSFPIYFIIASLIIISVISVLYRNVGKTSHSTKLLSIISDVSEKEKNKKEKYEKPYKLIDELYSGNQKHTANLKNIKQQISDSSSLLDNIVLAGDSYSGTLDKYLKDNYQYTNLSFNIAGKTVIENKDLYLSATEAGSPIIIFSIGYNDHHMQTSYEDFKSIVDEIFEKAYENNKLVIIHSYMDHNSHGIFDIEGKAEINKIAHYDYILKKSASYFNNVVYIDCKDLETLRYISADNIHYTYEFYTELFSRAVKQIKRTLKL